MAIAVAVVDPRPLVREALSHLLESYSEFDVRKPASSLHELVTGAPGDAVWVAVAGLGALQQVDDQAVLELTKYGKGIKILVLADDYNEDTVCHLLMLGCSGYLPGDASAETLRKAVLAVARG